MCTHMHTPTPTHTHPHTPTHTVCLRLYNVCVSVCACACVCLCMHVCVCLMCVCLAFRVMLNGMTKVATPLLTSSSNLGRPIGAPRVFFNSKYLLPRLFMCSMLYTTTGASIVFVLVAEKISSHIAQCPQSLDWEWVAVPNYSWLQSKVCIMIVSLRYCKLLLIAASLY